MRPLKFSRSVLIGNYFFQMTGWMLLFVGLLGPAFICFVLALAVLLLEFGGKPQ